MSSTGSLGILLTIAVIFLALRVVATRVRSLIQWRHRCRGRPLPPGPMPLPIIGNLLSMPRSLLWVGFRDLCKTYGELVYLNARGERILLLGSASAVEELLEKRSANMSDRASTAVMPLIGNNTVMSLMAYGQWWRHHRRAFWQVFHPAAARQYRNTQQVFLHKFLRKLVASPLDLKQHIRYIFAATMVKVLYDIDTRDDADELIARMDEAAGCTSVLASGTHPVDVFPFLQYVPSWVPGAHLIITK